MTGFEIAELVADDQRCPKVDVQLFPGQQDHAGAGLAPPMGFRREDTAAGFVVGAGDDQIDLGARSGQLFDDPSLDGTEILPAKIAASDAALVGDDDDPYPAIVRRSDQGCGGRNDPDILGFSEIADFLDDHAVAVAEQRRSAVRYARGEGLAPQGDAVDQATVGEGHGQRFTRWTTRPATSSWGVGVQISSGGVSVTRCANSGVTPLATRKRRMSRLLSCMSFDPMPGKLP